jgi:Ca2+-binding EF-hand superfamily protein
MKEIPMKAMATAIAAGSLFILATVDAQQAEPPEEQEPAEGIPATPHQEQTAREIKSDRFEQLDADRDGSISRQEAQVESVLVASWSKYDRNRDQKLDAEEFSAFEQSSASAAEAEEAVGQRGRTAAGMPATAHQEHAVRGDLIEQLDKDGDGGISQQEARGESSLAESWDQIDRNDDGKLDSSELDRFEQ